MIQVPLYQYLAFHRGQCLQVDRFHLGFQVSTRPSAHTSKQQSPSRDDVPTASLSPRGLQQGKKKSSMILLTENLGREAGGWYWGLINSFFICSQIKFRSSTRLVQRETKFSWKTSISIASSYLRSFLKPQKGGLPSHFRKHVSRKLIMGVMMEVWLFL